MELIVGACGLICSHCPAYVGTKNNDVALIEKTAQEWSVQFQTEIKPDDVWCTGCMTDGEKKCVHCASGCEIRKCVKERNFYGFGCAACDDRAGCAKVAFIAEHVPPTVQLLDALTAFRKFFSPEK